MACPKYAIFAVAVLISSAYSDSYLHAQKQSDASDSLVATPADAPDLAGPSADAPAAAPDLVPTPDAPQAESVNQGLADSEAAAITAAVTCASWAAVVVTAPGHNSDGNWRPTFKAAEGAAFTKKLFTQDAQPSESWCPELASLEPVSTGGAESRFIRSDTGTVHWVTYFRKLNGFGYNQTDAEAALTQAAQECTSVDGINPGNALKLTRCLDQHVLEVEDSKIAAVVVLTAAPASTLAIGNPGSLPIIRTTLTLTSKGRTADITLVALPQ